MSTHGRREFFSKRYGELGSNVLGGFCGANPLHLDPSSPEEDCTCEHYLGYAARVTKKLEEVLPSLRQELIVIEETVFEGLAETVDDSTRESIRRLTEEDIERVAKYISANSKS